MRVNSPRASWTLSIYRVMSQRRQQLVLAEFARLSSPGIVALGTQNDDGWFVVVDSDGPLAQNRGKRVVTLIDATATCTHTTSDRATGHPSGVSWA